MNELEEQKSQEALELLGREHKLVNLDRARMIQGMELSGAVGQFSGALDSSALDSCSPSVAQEADDAMSESSWTPLVKGKMLVETEGGSVYPKRKMGHWSARIKTTKEGIREAKGTENEKQEVEVDEATLHEASAEVQSPK